jgi:hypothetical protein
MRAQSSKAMSGAETPGFLLALLATAPVAGKLLLSRGSQRIRVLLEGSRVAQSTRYKPNALGSRSCRRLRRTVKS